MQSTDFIIFSLPIAGALIGWITNFIAVKLLFHPRKPRRFLFIPIQGVFPKRQAQFAEKLGEIVSTELLSAQEIQTALSSAAHAPETKVIISAQVEQAIISKLPSIVPMFAAFINPHIIDKVKESISEGIDQLVDSVIAQLQEKVSESLDVQRTVTEKVSSFSTDKIEEILYTIMRKEFQFVELTGAVLGFLIGLFQLAIQTNFVS